MESQRGTEIKVGLFVIVALFVSAILIFMIGSATQMFDKQVSLYTYFSSVSGLKVGSQVRLSGLKIGVVDQIWIGSPKELGVKHQIKSAKNAKTGKNIKTNLGFFGKGAGTKVKKTENYDLRKKYILVRMKVVQKMLSYMAADSVASIKGKGLLGDSLVEISMGTIVPKKGSKKKIQRILAKGVVPGVTPKSINDFISEGGVIISSLKRSLKSVEDILIQYKDPALSNNLKGIVSSTASLLKRAKTGPGMIHDIVYSKRLTRSMVGAISQVNGLTGSLKRTARRLGKMISRAKRRGTLLHTLILSRKSGKLVRNVNRTIAAARVAVSGLAQILQAPQRKGTLLYKILYSRETSRLVTNVVKSTDYLRTMMRDIRAGKGTLGAIINDPTAFEDFKTILGQVKRSRIFKTLIRFIIKRDDSSKGGRVLRGPNLRRRRRRK